MLVWKAISSIALAIFVISWALELILSIASEREVILAFASWTRWAISSDLARVWPVLSVTLASRSFTLDTS